MSEGILFVYKVSVFATAGKSALHSALTITWRAADGSKSWVLSGLKSTLPSVQYTLHVRSKIPWITLNIDELSAYHKSC